MHNISEKTEQWIKSTRYKRVWRGEVPWAGRGVSSRSELQTGRSQWGPGGRAARPRPPAWCWTGSQPLDGLRPWPLRLVVRRAGEVAGKDKTERGKDLGSRSQNLQPTNLHPQAPPCRSTLSDRNACRRETAPEKMQTICKNTSTRLVKLLTCANIWQNAGHTNKFSLNARSVLKT